MKKRKHYILMIAALLAVFAIGSSLQAANLIAQWKMDEGTGQVVSDSSGNGYHGQLGDFDAEDVSDPVWVDSSIDYFGLIRGPVLELDGTYFQKRFVNLDAYAPTFSSSLTKGTISAFFKKDTLAWSDPKPQHVNNNQVIFSISDNTQPSAEMILFCEKGALKVMSRGGTGNMTMASSANIDGEDVGVTDGAWHHAVLTVDGSGSATLYLDGVQVDTAMGANFLNNVANATSMAIGNNDDSGGGRQWAFDGVMSDVRVYDDALNATEIEEMIPIVGTIIETENSTEVTEGGATDTFDVVLNKAPGATVTVAIDPGPLFDVGVGVGGVKNLTFDSGNWDTPQTVTVTAFDDALAQGNIKENIWCLVSSTDPLFDKGWFAPRGVTATIYDNDTSGAVLMGHWKLDDNSGQIAADSSGNGYNGQLGASSAAEPNDPNWVASYTDNLLVTRGPVLEFDGNSYEKQRVDLSSHVGAFASLSQGTIATFFKQDNAEDDDSVSHTNNQVILSISDDSKGSSEFALICEGNALKVLARNDGASVLSLTSDVPLELDGNWHHAAVTVTAAGLANLYLDGALVDTAYGWFFSSIAGLNTMTIGANDDNGVGKQWGFDGLISDVRIYDDFLLSGEIRELIPIVGAITESDGSTEVTEGGASDTFDVVLNKAPSAAVTVVVNPGPQLDLGDGVGVVKNLTFDSGNWNMPQTVTITTSDDDIREGDIQESIQLSVSSTDSAFNEGWLVPRGVTVTILDDDTSGAELVAQWLLDDSTGQVAADSSGNGYDGQLGDTADVDITDPTWDNRAARFDGNYFNKQYVNLDAYAETFSTLNQGTITAWFRKDTLAESDPAPSHVNNNQVIFSISDNTEGSVELILHCEKGALKVMSRGGAGNISMASGDNIDGEDVGVTDGAWHHAALTVNGSGNATLYLDGVQVDTATDANFLDNVANPTSMAIGINDDSGAGRQWAFDGLLSDVRVYDGALSAVEIDELIPIYCQ